MVIPRAVAALSKLAERYGASVVATINARADAADQSSDAGRLRFRPPLSAETDLIISVECDVPWYPHLDTLKDG